MISTGQHLQVVKAIITTIAIDVVDVVLGRIHLEAVKDLEDEHMAAQTMMFSAMYRVKDVVAP